VDCLRLELDARAPRMARQHVRIASLDWGLSDDCRCHLDLLVSEAVTNAIVHAGTMVDLTLRLDDGLVSVAVRDFGGGTPEIRGTPMEVGGWGLRLLAGLSTRWGVLPADPGKVVWFEVARR
jgi:anti-sigma regulatory factor (Ser/Thr protein kinase)